MMDAWINRADIKFILVCTFFAAVYISGPSQVLLSDFGICFLYTDTCSVGSDLPMHVMSTKWISN